VHVDAHMVHGWPPSPCASERVISLWGTVCHHVEWGVSRFIPSSLTQFKGTAVSEQPHLNSQCEPVEPGPHKGDLFLGRIHDPGSLRLRRVLIRGSTNQSPM
jgi:hypothetical protein